MSGLWRQGHTGLADELEDAVLEQAGVDAVTFLGGATGIYCGYLDFIAWDIQAVLNAAIEIFEKSPHPITSYPES